MNILTRLRTRDGYHKAKNWHFCKSVTLNIGGKLVLNFEATPAVLHPHAESLKSWQTSQTILEFQESHISKCYWLQWTLEESFAVLRGVIYVRFKLIF